MIHHDSTTTFLILFLFFASEGAGVGDGLFQRTTVGGEGGVGGIGVLRDGKSRSVQQRHVCSGPVIVAVDGRCRGVGPAGGYTVKLGAIYLFPLCICALLTVQSCKAVGAVATLESWVRTGGPAVASASLPGRVFGKV